MDEWRNRSVIFTASHRGWFFDLPGRDEMGHGHLRCIVPWFILRDRSADQGSHGHLRCIVPWLLGCVHNVLYPWNGDLKSGDVCCPGCSYRERLIPSFMS